MEKMIVGIDRRNEVLAEKATKIVKRSTLKLILAREYAELNKVKLLIHLVFFLVVATIIAAGASYVSAYEYSYNGRVLGVVKNQESEDALKKILTGAVQTKVHIVGPGDTFSGVAKKYGIKSGILLESNPSVTPEKLSIGEEIVLTQAVPLITVQTVEVSTYMEPIAFEKTTENADNMYKGEKSVKVRGVIGEREVVARIIKNNGTEISKIELKATVIEEPIKEIMLVGTKALPSLQGSGTYIYPVVGARLSQRYSSSHRAIDLAISTGSKVRAADGGTVIYAGYSGSYGYVIRINHGRNRVTLYAHSSKLLVRAGDKVYQGQQIAYSGSTGRSTGPHLHFEVIINGVQKNPLNYI